MLPPPPPALEAIAGAASGIDFDPPAGFTHGVRVSLSAETFDGSCVLSDETGETPSQGVDSAALSLSCPGANAFGAAELVDEILPDGSFKRVWTLHGHADAVAGADAEANLYAADTYTPTLEEGTPGPTPTPADAHLFLHVDVSGEIEGGGSGFAEYETDARFWKVLPDGSFELFAPVPVFPSPFDRFVDENGLHESHYDVDLPPVPFGTTLLMDNGFLFDLAIASGGAEYLSDATAKFSLCSHDAGVRLDSASGSTGECPAVGDVGLVSVEPVQSVFGASRLIARKDAVVAVDLVSSNPSPVGVSIEWSVQQGGASTSFTDDVTVPGNCPSKRIYLPHPDPSFMSFCEVPSEPMGSLLPLQLAPIEGSEYHVSVRVHAPEGADSDPTNDEREVSRPVTHTFFSPAFTRIGCESGNCGAGYGTLSDTDFQSALLLGNLETLAMYPIGSTPGDFTPSSCLSDACVVPGDDEQCEGETIDDCPGILSDYVAARRALKAENHEATALATYVPGNYFFYHGFQKASDAFFTAGITILSADGDSVSFIRADTVTGASPEAPGQRLPTTPHELVHNVLFDPGHDEEASVGFWVGCPGEVCGAGPENLMQVKTSHQPPAVWIDNEKYESLLGELKVLPDPPVLDISGTVTRQGVVSIRYVDEFPEGRVSQSHGTGFSVVVLDGEGNVLSEVTGSGNFDHPTSDPRPMSWNTMPFGVSIAYPQSAVSVEIREGSTVLLRVDPLSWTLRTAIQTLPDRAFDKNPDQRRKALLAKVDALEKSLANKAYDGALHQLQEDLRGDVQKWVLASYPAPHVLEATQASVLEQIDRVVGRVQYLQTASGKPHP